MILPLGLNISDPVSLAKKINEIIRQLNKAENMSYLEKSISRKELVDLGVLNMETKTTGSETLYFDINRFKNR